MVTDDYKYFSNPRLEMAPEDYAPEHDDLDYLDAVDESKTGDNDEHDEDYD